jgi:hypothetical protein
MQNPVGLKTPRHLALHDKKPRCGSPFDGGAADGFGPL